MAEPLGRRRQPTAHPTGRTWPRWACALALAAPRAAEGIIDFVGRDTPVAGRLGAFSCGWGWDTAGSELEFELFARLRPCNLTAIGVHGEEVLQKMQVILFRPRLVAVNDTSTAMAACLRGAAFEVAAAHPDAVGWQADVAETPSLFSGLLLVAVCVGLLLCCGRMSV